MLDLIIGLFLPSNGEIKIDDVSLNEGNLQNWRSKIGYIPQNLYLFDDTVAKNVCFGRQLDQGLLVKVLKQANIYDFLQTKDGVDTLVGEGGIQISGGQKQRIAIARAILADPKIIILDEATSNLDTESESLIQKSLETLTKNRTTIVIAHRLSTIKRADQILVIEKGEIAEQGNHDFLIEKQGRYYDLYTYQAKI